MAKDEKRPEQSKRSSRRTILGWLAVAAVLVAGGLFWMRTSSETAAIDPDDSQQVALGAKIYAENCAQCHGANLQGQPDWRIRKPDGKLPAPPHDSSGHTWHHPDSYIFDVTKNGVLPYAPPGYKSDMPAFAGILTDDEIRAAIAFIESKWPPEIRARHAAMSKMMMKGM